MKKVLILSGSPRKGGNSDLLCDEFLRGAQESGNEVQKIFVRSKKIAPCNACYYCRDHGGKCALNDDMSEILDAMQAADVIVMASPVYFYIFLLHAVVLSPCHAVGSGTQGVGLPGRAGLVSGSQRAVGHQRNAHLFADWDQLPLILAVKHVVVIFHGREGRPAVVPRG